MDEIKEKLYHQARALALAEVAYQDACDRKSAVVVDSTSAVVELAKKALCDGARHYVAALLSGEQ